MCLWMFLNRQALFHRLKAYRGELYVNRQFGMKPEGIHCWEAEGLPDEDNHYQEAKFINLHFHSTSALKVSLTSLQTSPNAHPVWRKITQTKPICLGSFWGWRSCFLSLLTPQPGSVQSVDFKGWIACSCLPYKTSANPTTSFCSGTEYAAAVAVFRVKLCYYLRSQSWLFPHLHSSLYSLQNLTFYLLLCQQQNMSRACPWLCR